MSQEPTEQTVKTYRARRRLRVPAGWREPRELYPEAVLIGRVDSHVHTGRIVEVEVGVQEFMDALDQHNVTPEDRQKILERSGLDPDVMPVGPHRTPRARKPTKKVAVEATDTPPPTRVGGPKSGTRAKKPVPPTKRVPAGGGAGKKQREDVKGTKLVTRPKSLTDHPELVPLRSE